MGEHLRGRSYVKHDGEDKRRLNSRCLVGDGNLRAHLPGCDGHVIEDKRKLIRLTKKTRRNR